jgi:hypothetical protein
LKEGRFEEVGEYLKSFGNDLGYSLPIIDELRVKGIILNNPTDLENVILSNKFTGITDDSIIDSFLDDYRNKFKNKKTGAIGSKTGCRNKFKAFFQEFPEYMDKDLILSATDRYINSCRKDGFKYMMQADYFIYKRKDDGGGNTSTLAIYCEEIQAGIPQDTSSNADLPKWT